jgi:hypothetical protein
MTQQQNPYATRASVHPHYTRIQVAGKVIGHVAGDTLHKTVRSSKHQLRCPPAWALDCHSLDDAERLGAQRVEIQDLDSGQTYTASIPLIRQFGFTLDRGWGKQIALPLQLWTCHSTKAQQLRLWTAA